MKSEFAEEIFALIEARSPIRPTTMEFEMAYQTRVAIDRIRFAIKHTEQSAPSTDQMRDVGIQLLDALQRLESTNRRFQARSQGSLPSKTRKPIGSGVGRDEPRSMNQANRTDGAQRHR